MDPVAVQRWAARQVTASPWLHNEVGSRMAERLRWIKQPPLSWLDWEPVNGGLEAHRSVCQVLPDAQAWVAARHSQQALEALRRQAQAGQPWWARWRGQGPRVCSADTRVHMVWANMALHLSDRPLEQLRRWHSLLHTDGFVMFACLGPDTAKELRAVYQAMGWAPASHAFTDMHDLGDMLVQEGFAEPVMDVETITLTYSGAHPLLAELRTLGRNFHSERCATVRGRTWLNGLHQAIETHGARTPQGQLALTFEVVYGHAFKPRPRIKVASSSSVSLEAMRTLLGTSANPRPR